MVPWSVCGGWLMAFTVYFGCSKQELHHVYPRDALPVCEPGSSLLPVGDDRSKKFRDLYREVKKEGTLRRREKSGRGNSRRR